MELLLDTNALIWALSDPHHLAPSARAHLEDGRNRLFVSAASTWEIAIKVALGKLRVPPALETWLPARLAEAQMTQLPIAVSHTLVVEHLPSHHKDPFDRLLIAQALAERLTVVSADTHLARYGVRVIPC